MSNARTEIVRRARSAIRRRGLDVVRYRPGPGEHLDPDAVRTVTAVRPYTMTADDSLFSLIESVRYLVRHDVAGCIVECGVWRGGSMLAAALTLQQLDAADRALYLYDTFEGMTAPGEDDVLLHGDARASDLLAATDVGDGANVWCFASLDDVRAAVGTADYPRELVRYVVGPVERTLPAQAPEGPIALLRLDTDWYESTRHELEHLVPMMSPGGVLVIDDYWHWGGCRKAVDEYLAQSGLRVLLTKVDITAVGVVVPA